MKMDILAISKILSFIAVILVGGIGVCIPIYIGYLNPTLLQYINVFAGGTLLTLALCHLLPEADVLVKANKMSFYIFNVEIPIVAYLTLLGLTIILFFEKALFSPQTVAQFHMHDHSFPHKRDHHHHHHKDPGCVGMGKRISNSKDETLSSLNDNQDERIIISMSSCETNNHNVLSEDEKNHGIRTPLISSSSNVSSKSTDSPIQTSSESLASTSSSNIYFLVSALSVHSIFEGMLVGISENHISVMTITLVIIAHKWVEGIAVSAGIKKHSEISQCITKQLLFSFIIMSPIGILLGQLFWFINSPFINVILTCISAGVLLYVALSEMILDEFNCGENRKQKFFLFILGILLVSIINLIQHKLGGCVLHHGHGSHHFHSDHQHIYRSD